MSRIALFLALIGLTACATPATGTRLPDTIGYTIYQEGNPVGSSSIRTKRAGDDLVVMESRTTVKSPSLYLTLESRSEVDPAGWQIRRFVWNGNASGTPYEGDLRYDGTAYSGHIIQKGQRVEETRKPGSSHVVFFENYVPAHEILIARAQIASGKATGVWEALFPSSYSQHELRVSVESEVLVESTIREAVCRKLVIRIKGSPAFASYYDESAGLPVYIVFPDSATEIFLDSFYGDDPISRFVPRDPGTAP